MTVALDMSVETYRCETCLAREGRVVRQLVRMVPVSVVMAGELVGDEFYCCPVCFEPKFSVKTRKKVVAKPKQSRSRLHAVPAAG